MRSNLLIYIFVPFFIFSQNLDKKIIDDKIKQLKDQTAENKFEEKKILLLYNELYHMSKKAGHKEGMLTSLTGQAVIYVNKDEMNKGLKVISEGIVLAKELNKDADYTALMACKGRALMAAGNYSDSRINFAKALKMSDMVRNKDTMNNLKTLIFSYLTIYAEVLDQKLNNAGYRDSMLYFGQKSYDTSIKISEKEPRKNLIVGQSALLLGIAYMKEGNVGYGNKYFNIAEKLFTNDHDKRPLAHFYNVIGSVKFEKGDDNQALEYYDKAFDLATEFNSPILLIGIYENYIEYYKKKGDTKKELYYLQKSKKLSDSLSDINKKALIVQGKDDISLITNQGGSGNRLLVIILVIFIAIGAVPFYLYRKNKAKRSAGKFDKVNYYEEKQVDEDTIASLLLLAKNNDKQFLVIFQEVFKDLHKEFLKFPELTSADLEMCAYLKLNIQTKEIAAYKKTSIGAVDNRKYRIRKKLNLLPETDLYKWINTINPKTQ